MIDEVKAEAAAEAIDEVKADAADETVDEAKEEEMCIRDRSNPVSQ